MIIPSGSSGNPGLEDAVSVFATGSDTRFQDLRSYINSVTFSPDGMTIMASMEGSDAIVVIPQNVKTDRKRKSDELDERETTAIVTGAGPRGVAFVSKDKAFVHNFLDNQVADANFEEAFERMVQTMSGDPQQLNMSRLQTVSSIWLSLPRMECPFLKSPLADVANGRRMFFGAMDERVAIKGGGVLCYVPL